MSVEEPAEEQKPDSEYDQEYIDSLIEKASVHWKDVDSDEFMNELRQGE